MNDQQRIETAADNCEVLRARLARYEDAEGNPIAQPSGVVMPLMAALESVVHDERVPNEVSQEVAAVLIEAQCLNSSPVSAGEPVYQFQCREIGEGDWEPCDHSRYMYCQKSPEHDTRVVQVGISAGVVDDRAAFEPWYLGHFYMGDKQCGLEWLSTEPCGGYRHQHPAEQWVVWQARAALSAPSHGEQVREVVPESFSFQYRHAFNGETRTVSMRRDEVADGMDDTLYEKLLAQICECEPVGETNVVDCNCSDYADDFDLVRAPSAGSQEQE